MELAKHADRLRARGYGICSISYDTVDVLREFANRRGITYPMLSDPDSAIIRAFGLINEEVTDGICGSPWLPWFWFMWGRLVNGQRWPADALGDLAPVQVQAHREGDGVPQRVVDIAVSFRLRGQRLDRVVGDRARQLDIVDEVGEPAVYPVVDAPAQSAADGLDGEPTGHREFDELVEQTGERAGQEHLQRGGSGVRAAALAWFVDYQPVVGVRMRCDLMPQLLHLGGVDADGADAPAAARDQMIDHDLDEFGIRSHQDLLRRNRGA